MHASPETMAGILKARARIWNFPLVQHESTDQPEAIARPSVKPAPTGERRCANPACGAVLARRDCERLCYWRVRATCCPSCAHAVIVHRAAVDAAESDPALAVMAQHPERWWASPDLARASGDPMSSVATRLRRWRNKRGWVESRGKSGSRAMRWHITKPGLAAVRGELT